MILNYLKKFYSKIKSVLKNLLPFWKSLIHATVTTTTSNWISVISNMTASTGNAVVKKTAQTRHTITEPERIETAAMTKRRQQQILVYSEHVY
jgi:hypothetical protein